MNNPLFPSHPDDKESGFYALKQIFNSLPGMYLILSKNAIIQAASDSFLEATLTVREEILGKSIFDVFPDNPAHPEAHAVFNLNASLHQAITTKLPHTMPLQHYDVPRPAALGGGFETRYWLPSNTPVLDEKGEVQYIIYRVVNVTEKIKIKKLLKDSQLREQMAIAEAGEQRIRMYNMLMEAPAIIALFNGPDHVFQLVNPSFQRLYAHRTMLGKPIRWALPELKNQIFVDALDMIYNTGNSFAYKAMPAFIYSKGSDQIEEGFFDFNGQATRDNNGNISGVLIIGYDVTAQVKALRQTEVVLDSMMQIAWTTNAKGETTYLNKICYNYVGVNPSKPQKMHLVSYVHLDDKNALVAAWKKSFRTGDPLEMEVRINRISDNSSRWHLIRFVPIHNATDEISMWVGTATDIHKQKLAEESLKSLSEELAITNNALLESNDRLTRINVDLDNFIYSASHDLKAPISNIEGLLSVLRYYLTPENDISQKILPITDHMQESVKRFKTTIANLAEVVKLQKEENEEDSQLNVIDVVNEVIMDLQPLIELSEAKVEVKLHECPTISFMNKNLRSIIYNLISNAIKYRSPERSPEVLVFCTQEPEYTVLTVKDNGLGMDLSKDKKKLFVKFQRFHTHVDGTGIGLYMVKRIVENTGGKIEVQSKVGEGTAFRVFFKRQP